MSTSSTAELSAGRRRLVLAICCMSLLLVSIDNAPAARTASSLDPAVPALAA